MRTTSLLLLLSALWAGPTEARARRDKPASETASGSLRTWIDAEGVTHLTRAPSDRAVKRAERERVIPQATGQRTRVRDTRQYDAVISRAAARYSIPHALIRAVIVAESNFNPQAVSPVGAQGLMQLMPGTAREMYCEDAYDPEQNIEGGTRYLRILANGFNGDLVKTIAAYNAGPEAVRRAGGIPRFAETQGYVKRVLSLYRIYLGQGR